VTSCTIIFTDTKCADGTGPQTQARCGSASECSRSMRANPMPEPRACNSRTLATRSLRSQTSRAHESRHRLDRASSRGFGRSRWQARKQVAERTGLGQRRRELLLRFLRIPEEPTIALLDLGNHQITSLAGKGPRIGLAKPNPPCALHSGSTIRGLCGRGRRARARCALERRRDADPVMSPAGRAERIRLAANSACRSSVARGSCRGVGEGAAGQGQQ
jgi:hypothetical protein